MIKKNVLSFNVDGSRPKIVVSFPKSHAFILRVYVRTYAYA